MSTLTVGEVLGAMAGRVWAVDESRGLALEQFLWGRRDGAPLLSDADVATLRGLAGGGTPRGARSGVVAVLPVYGMLTNHESIFTQLFGGLSYNAIGAAIDQLVADPSVSTIVLDVDSGGGEVQGADELATKIYAARAQKPIIAVSDSVMASAAYYIASAATEVVATPSSLTGAIGVYMMNVDTTEADAKDGIKREVISAGRYKAEGLVGPLSDEARAAFQAVVDGFYDQFVAAVARNRGTTPAAVKAGYGEGRVLLAQDAKAAGLVDRIASFDDTLGRLVPRAPRGMNADWLRRRMALDADRKPV